MVHIDGSWQKTPEKRGTPPSYTATGTKGEAIVLKRTRPKSHRGAPWVLTVTPIDGEAVSLTMGGPASFDRAEGALLTWGETAATRTISDGSVVAYLHTSDAHRGAIECRSNGNVLDLRCQPGYCLQVARSRDDPTLVRVWLVQS